MKLSLRQIEIFLNTVDLGHLTRVAEKLGVSQSAISMSIKELESILGKQLFNRINKKLILNEVGRDFYQSVEPLFKRIEDIERDFKNTKARGLLRIGASTTIVDNLMPSIICKHSIDLPDVKLELVEARSKDLVEQVKSGLIDIAFIESPTTDSDIVSEEAGEDEMIVVTADPKYSKGRYNMEDLLDQNWLLESKGRSTREVFMSKIKEVSGDLNIFLELGHVESIKSLLKKGKTFACLSSLATQKEIENGELFRVKVNGLKCTRNFYIIYHKNKCRGELFNDFLDFSKQMMSISNLANNQ